MNNKNGCVIIDSDIWASVLKRDQFSYQGRLLPLHNDPVPNVKHVFLWLHPTRGVQLVYITDILQCVWRKCSWDGRTMADIAGVPNGGFHMAGQGLQFSFNWQAEEDNIKPIFFEPLNGSNRWYRAVSETHDSARNPPGLNRWHVVIYRFK